LAITHFNDVYNIEARAQEPCGGAARFVTKALELAKEHSAMTLFSGDCLNPSLLSTVTNGWQMAPVLNAMGIHTACLGNHDFDFGLENLTRFVESTNFPWLMANVLDPKTQRPLAGALPTRLCEWQGIKVGLVGLVEKEWLETLSCVDISQVEYLDFVEEGRRLADKLSAEGAELIIALTHMRVPNDQRLAREAPEIHLILGGHDHHYEAGPVGPHRTWVVKSGTDFRELSLLTVELPQGGVTLQNRPIVCSKRIEITKDIPEHQETAETVKSYMLKLGDAMDEVVGETSVDLDGRFKIIRTQESNLGNFVCDCWRLASKADLAVLNRRAPHEPWRTGVACHTPCTIWTSRMYKGSSSDMRSFCCGCCSGTLRSDTIHPKGPLTMRDLVAILPMLDETVVLEASGQDILDTLNNGVSKWPALEGRFLQVSGVRFDFDPELPPGKRVIEDSVFVCGKPIDMNKKDYRLAVKSYMAQGKDGFDGLAKLKELVRADEGTLLPTTIKEHFSHLTTLVHPEYLEHASQDTLPDGLADKPKALLKIYQQSRMDLQEGQDAEMKRVSSSTKLDSSIIAFDHERGLFTISPEVNHRIVCLAPQ